MKLAVFILSWRLRRGPQYAYLEGCERALGAPLTAVLRVEGRAAVLAAEREDVLRSPGVLGDPVRQVVDVAVYGGPALGLGIRGLDVRHRVFGRGILLVGGLGVGSGL